MKDNRRAKGLIKVIQRIYDKNPEMRQVYALMIEVCTEEGVSPEQVFFILLFLYCCLYHNGYYRRESNQEY